MKRNFSGLTLQDVMEMAEQENLTRWSLDALPLRPSATLIENLRRLEAFDLGNTEAAKLLLIDTLLAEIVPNHPRLKVWKAALLESDTLSGISDYLIAPKRAYLSTPLLCAVEAKRDDFVQGRTQCLAEMLACTWNNRKKGFDSEVFGIVSNGQIWQFYRLAMSGEIFETAEYTSQYLPELLGALDFICVECDKFAL